MLRRTVITTLAALAIALPAAADTFPSRPVRLIVAYSAGGTGDVVARIIGDRLGQALGQSVIVENRAGASGAIGATTVLNALPDGHTLLVGQTAEIVVNQHWLRGLTYDPKELMPVALATVVPLGLTIPGSASATSMADLLKAIDSAAKPLTFASAGTGTPGHFAGEYLGSKKPGKLVHVPYKGAGPALNDIVGGHVDMYFSGLPAVMPLMKSGSVKVLAVSSSKRSDAAPEIPTVAETTGSSDFDFTLWQGFFAPRGTPPDVIAKLNREINKVLADPTIRQRLVDAGANVAPMSIAEFANFVQAESAKYERIIRETGVKPD
ncbi:MAG: tripartite tricarboxylate transporter substrate binding protein [Alphaproteobacteria bacterium]|nr:tripartite tricarboxylate transporter substrate binding protein [Alphaproteobacteria bacterium]